MLRNLAAIIIATIVGLSVAKFVEGAIGGGVTPGQTASASENAGLLIGWGIGAFCAASISLLIGRRWAPLGWLGAGTVFFAAIITLLSFSLPFWLWPLSAAVCGAGGWGAVVLLKANRALPEAPSKRTLF